MNHIYIHLSALSSCVSYIFYSIIFTRGDLEQTPSGCAYLCALGCSSSSEWTRLGRGSARQPPNISCGALCAPPTHHSLSLSLFLDNLPRSPDALSSPCPGSGGGRWRLAFPHECSSKIENALTQPPRSKRDLYPDINSLSQTNLFLPILATGVDATDTPPLLLQAASPQPKIRGRDVFCRIRSIGNAPCRFP